MKTDSEWEKQTSSVESFVKKMFSVWDQRDVEKIVPYYDPDARYVGPEGKACCGTEELGKMLTWVYQIFPSPTKLDVTPEKIQFLKEDIAVVDCHWKQSGGPEGMPGEGQALLILCKSDGEWLVAYHRALVPQELPGSGEPSHR